jgi:hypothetical protein
VARDDVFGPDRRAIRWKGEYLEVVAPERLVLTFSDRPDEVYERVTVVLNDFGSGSTEMLFEQRGHMLPEEYERTKEGWAVFFDRMQARLRAPVLRRRAAQLNRKYSPSAIRPAPKAAQNQMSPLPGGSSALFDGSAGS